MKFITKMLSDRHGEGHINTAVKIIIAVVIGTLVLGGLYALFSLVVFPSMNDQVQDMVHYNESPTTFRYDAFDTSVASLQYSYDGTTWMSSEVPEFGENAVIKKTLQSTEKDFALALVNDEDTIYIIMTEDNGKTWAVAHNVGRLNLADKRVDYYLHQNPNGTYGMIVRTYDGRTSTSGWGYDYKSDDGRTWRRASFGIDYF